MSKWGIGIMVILAAGGMVGYYFWPRKPISPNGAAKQTEELNLEKYDFDNLRLNSKNKNQKTNKFEILGTIDVVEMVRKEKQDFTTREIRFLSEGKWISGMLNYYPEKSSLSPVIIMIRGYAESAGYFPGSGSWRVADQLAKNGYTTISLDFLGYGNSDKESEDVLEARFFKVTQVIDLIETVKYLPWVDKNRIGIWAHSNGGQIALSVLEVTGEKYPTVLWAPMTQSFPESVLSTNEPDSPIVAIIRDFERQYDARRYAFENYYHWIQAPIIIQQGTSDVWCKVEWQQDLQSRLSKLGKDVDLVVYDGADHNLKGAWEQAVEKDVEWYAKYLKLATL